MKQSISCFIILLFATLIVSAQDQRPMTAMDIASLKFVGSAVLSEDGKHIAYTRYVQSDPTKENKRARYELHVYDMVAAEGSAFITRGSVRSLAFRPGHNAITFLNRLDGAKKTTLYEIPLRGGEAREVLAFDSSIRSYAWSPDGKSVAFVAAEQSEEKKAKLPYEPEIYESNLTYARAWLANLEKDETVQLDVEGNVSALAWSPMGGKLVMAIAESPLVDDHYMEQQLHVFNLKMNKIEGSIDHEGKLGEFCMSPDGGKVAFIAGADIHDPIDGRLFVVDAKGGKPTALQGGWLGAFEDIEWVEAGKIHFLGSKGSEAAWGWVSVDGEELTENVGNGMAVGAFDMNADGKVAFTASRWNHPPELFYATGSNDAKRLTTSNPWLKDIKMGKQEVIRYKAKDGLEVEGVLVYPVEYDEQKKYPLLVSVHGGPEAHIDNGWVSAYSRPGQVAAGNGYAVFYPNYRGSTGRGLDYIVTSQGDAAGKEFDDIVDGVDHLIETGLVDKAKVGVTGGSYGGYATGWLSTKYTDRFAAGVMFVGISNKISKWGTTDIPKEEHLVHARNWIWDDYDFYLERSPIYHAGKCKTPLLIMHGKEDPRVHPSQSMEMYRHVKSRTDTPVQLVFYPGEGHGNANSTARYDYNLRMMSWFDQYVKGEKQKS